MKDKNELLTRWEALLEHKDVPAIDDNYRKIVTAKLLENTRQVHNEELGMLTESAAPTQTTAAIANFDPVIISMVRRSMPNLVAFDVAGVQPMNGPTGYIFAMKSRYNGKGNDTVTTSDTEALFNEADTAFTGTSGQTGNDPFDVSTYSAGTGVDTTTLEGLGTSGNEFSKMGFTIERATVEAVGRGISADYTTEMAHDMKLIHGLDAENELAKILSTEVLAEINREMIRTINTKSVLGCSGTSVSGTFDLSADADGRWAVEKFKSLLFQIELEANAIAKGTRRGKGNKLICSSNVASALSAAGVLDYTPAMSTQLNVDDTGSTFAGMVGGRIGVYIDPYSTVDYATLVYRGNNPYDAGWFYCPYVPLSMVKATAEDTFQPRIGFKTRYAIQANPYVSTSTGPGANRSNNYGRIFKVLNINVA
jgi:hypothetical protein